ncbi:MULTISPECIES: fructose PTS transporter subunit IIA [unclassified Exiguobacterium]|uniref:PTS sugar transporter subunit IIA n=1 Tax=unclassified Exiguobacterium TaxID=2644629 RepID=UPI002036FEDA|nr:MULTISPECIES: fructose PTS transporter subunit IIA [unclassified Exiguobacterium]
MKLMNYMEETLIELDLAATSREEAFEVLTRKLDEAGYLNDRVAFVTALEAREALSSTGIGFEVAIPHGKTNAVNRPVIAFAKAPKGIEWDSLDGEPAKLIFMIGVPEASEGDEHLRILALLSRRLIDDEFRNKLKEATTVEEVVIQLETVYA